LHLFAYFVNLCQFKVLLDRGTRKPMKDKSAAAKGFVSRMLLCVTSLVAYLCASASAAAPQDLSPTGRTAADAAPPSWPRNPTAPQGAPNLLLILTDDVGFGASSTFGGPVPTPTFDALAARGLRYNQFHTTSICSPTRASLLTGRNPHNVGVGNVTNLPSGYPGYTSVIPPSAATVAEILRINGYATAMFGKGHITPEWEMSQAGPFDRWPTGLGFQHFYGFLGADMSMFAPLLVENTQPVEPALGRRDYHFDEDLGERASTWIREQHALAPTKPLFVYYATGTAHAPNHAPGAWLEKFRGRFDAGWDQVRAETFARQKKLGVIPANAALAARPAELPAWNSLPESRRRLYARYMEAYAASLAYADAQIGRVINTFRELGLSDNTLIIYIQGDNGASTEGGMHGRLFEQSGVNSLPEDPDYALSRIDEIGGPKTYPLNPGGWGYALNTPFPWAKRIASHLGGTRNGMVISWPARIRDAGASRSQFHHVSDVMPTILEAARVEAPTSVNGVAQKPLDGISMLYTLDDARASSHRRTQVFEVFENLGLYHDGWLVSTRPVGTPWDATRAPRVALDKRTWELYDLRTDFSQTRDLARANPKQLATLQEMFWAEATSNNILPIHPPSEGSENKPTLTAGRTTFTYSPGIANVPESSAPPIMRRRFSITADVVIPESGANGVLVTQGGRFGGYGFYVHDGRAVFHYNAIDPRHYAIRTSETLTPGAHQLVAEFVPDNAEPGAGGRVTLSIDGRTATSGRVEKTLTAWLSHTEGFDVGEDHGTAVSADYSVEHSRFTGVLQKLVVSLQ
jgi:arylsulfatase A-like enzyme